MKKIIVIVLALALVSQVVPAFAEQLYDSKQVIANNTSAKKVTYIPSTIIKPNVARILYFDVTSLGTKGTVKPEVYAGLYDATCTTSLANLLEAALEGEIESADDDSVSRTYGRPLKIYNGVTIIQGPYTSVCIEWEEHL